jgi:hypothetical protein
MPLQKLINDFDNNDWIEVDRKEFTFGSVWRGV